MNIISIQVDRSMNQEQALVPTLGRMMVFIDGENLVLRFQEMLRDDLHKPQKGVVHEKDIYVWQRKTVQPGLNQVVRATYYTYAFGDENRIREVNKQIKELSFAQYLDPHARYVSSRLLNNLYPRVFRKLKGKKAKGVDIQLTVDILSNVYMNNLDTVYLVSGDGDYKPVLEEVLRYGKHVYVAALPSGLNEELKYIADKFIDLENIYFKAKEV
jgi:uncharacterized protein (TIGR00288 family)